MGRVGRIVPMSREEAGAPAAIRSCGRAQSRFFPAGRGRGRTSDQQRISCPAELVVLTVGRRRRGIAIGGGRAQIRGTTL